MITVNVKKVCLDKLLLRMFFKKKTICLDRHMIERIFAKDFVVQIEKHKKAFSKLFVKQFDVNDMEALLALN